VLTGIVALHKRNLGSIGTPLHGLRSPAGESTFGKNVFNRELLRGGGGLLSSRGNSQDNDQEKRNDISHLKAPRIFLKSRAEKCTPSDYGVADAEFRRKRGM
jgi:hypothetical protein